MYSVCLSMPALIPHLHNKFHWFDFSRRQPRPAIECPTGRNHAQIELSWPICADNQYVNFSTTAEQLTWYHIVCCVIIKRLLTFAHLKRYKNCRWAIVEFIKRIHAQNKDTNVTVRELINFADWKVEEKFAASLRWDWKMLQRVAPINVTAIKWCLLPGNKKW